jgi:hypothetical protein
VLLSYTYWEREHQHAFIMSDYWRKRALSANSERQYWCFRARSAEYQQRQRWAYKEVSVYRLNVSGEV